MSSYTMELRTLIEHYTQYEDLPLNERIEEGRKKLFDFDYPFFDSDYKKIFETNFIKNFYMREIGFETEGLFKLRLDTWLNINMPYYNKLFESERIKYDPLYNTDVIIETNRNLDKSLEDKRLGDTSTENQGEQTTSGKSKLNENKDSFNRHLESDTPDERLRLTTNEDGSGVIEYASRIDEDKSRDNLSSQSESDTISNVSNEGRIKSEEEFTRAENELEDFQERRKGKIGQQSFASMMMEYRNSLIRIERMIFDEMNELFMLVY